jgi:hypothetical protein
VKLSNTGTPLVSQCTAAWIYSLCIATCITVRVSLIDRNGNISVCHAQLASGLLYCGTTESGRAAVMKGLEHRPRCPGNQHVWETGKTSCLHPCLTFAICPVDGAATDWFRLCTPDLDSYTHSIFRVAFVALMKSGADRLCYAYSNHDTTRMRKAQCVPKHRPEKKWSDESIEY